METKIAEQQSAELADEFELIELGSVFEETKGSTGPIREGANQSML